MIRVAKGTKLWAVALEYERGRGERRRKKRKKATWQANSDLVAIWDPRGVHLGAKPSWIGSRDHVA